MIFHQRLSIASLLTSLLLPLLASATLAASAATTQPPPPPAQPVTETPWGQKVTDDYRFMEKLGPETIDWMKAEGAYTRTLLDSIPGRAALGKRVAAFTGSFGFISGYVNYGGRAFYEERKPDAENFDVMVRDAKGTRKIVDIEAIMKAHGGKPYAVNYFLASPDGSKVAVGVSEGGSEAAKISVYDAATSKQIAGPLDRAQFGATSWSPDSKTLYWIRLKQLAPGESPLDTYKDASVVAWNLTSAPVPVAGNGVSKHATFLPDEIPAIQLSPNSPIAFLASINGVQREIKLWTAPAADASNPNAPWKLFIDRSDDVTGMDVRGDEIFLLSHKDASNFKVLEVKAGAPLASAKVLVPEASDRVIESINAAADGLYVMARNGAYSELLRVPTGSDKIEKIALPIKGHIGEVFSDPRVAGITFEISSWVVPPTEYRYEPKAGKFADLHLGVHGDIDAANYVVSDLEAQAYDGIMVPLSLIEPKGTKRPGIVVLEAYGSYGITNLADFSPRRAAFMKEGIAYGICHVRGSSIKGQAWYMAGKGPNKHNTWQDLIACGKYLVAQHITTPKQLFILGGSAGGITMGRAMEEAPDLFAGVMDIVPAANTLRMEFTPNGPPNIPEFGSIKTKQGFEDLYAMDSVVHVKKGTTYPAILISTGLNDPRVAPWVPAKFAAAMMAAGSPNPVLLRIDTQAGHGIGSTRSQSDELAADWIAFVFWRAGLPDWQPTLETNL
ncbi:MAG: prolyl oligopeptidase family serine peptidase [Gammaproteobacteria bacterium]